MGMITVIKNFGNRHWKMFYFIVSLKYEMKKYL